MIAVLEPVVFDFLLTRFQLIQVMNHCMVENRLVSLLVRNGGGAFAKTVAELSADNFQMAHPAGAGGLPTFGLHAPIVAPALGPGVS